MDSWRVAVLGDGGVGKTALAVQVRASSLLGRTVILTITQFTLNCFVGTFNPIEHTATPFSIADPLLPLLCNRSEL